MRRLRHFVYVLSIFTVVSDSSAGDVVFKDIADELSSIKDRINNNTIAVFPFDDSGTKGKGSGKYFSEKLIHELVLSGKLKVIERESVDRIIKERELIMSGAVSAETAAMIGKLLAVDAIITGTINSRGDKTEISIRATDTRTGLVLKSISRDYYDAVQKSGFIDTWDVTETANYFFSHGIRYKKIILKADGSYALHLINNKGNQVLFKGIYYISGNNIDYRPREMFIDGRPADLPGRELQKGTVYIVDGKLYFTAIDLEKGSKRRLDAMEKRYRNIAERR